MPVGSARQFKGDEFEARKFLRGKIGREPPQGAVRFLAYGDQNLSPEDRSVLGLGGAPSFGRGQAGFGGGEAELFRQQEAKQKAFLGKFGTEFPAALKGIEQELGLPGLRETAFTTGEILRKTPERQTQATRGFDVSQGQLERIIASDVAKFAPLAQTAIQQAQFGEAELGRRAERAIKPFEIEAGFLGENIKNQVQLFRDRVKGDLDTTLAKLQTQGQLSLQELKNAASLAQMEFSLDAARDQGTFRDLGDRVALINPATGEEIQSFSKGLAPARGQGRSDAELQTLSGQHFG